MKKTKGYEGGEREQVVEGGKEIGEGKERVTGEEIGIEE